MKKTTLKDIAKQCNVSISTVSKALNNSDEISEETRFKIQEYARSVNYKPNLNALSLKNSRTRTIGILIPDMLNYFHAQVLKGIEKTAIEHNYKVIICITNDSFSKEKETLEMLSNGSVDGFIVSLAEETELKQDVGHFSKTIDFNLPVVMFDRVANEIMCDKVITNNFEAAKIAVKQLVNSGCKSIAFASAISHLKVSQDLYRGYKEGLLETGLIINDALIVNTRVDHYSGYESMLQPLFEQGSIDAILATNEEVALAAMKIALRKGMKIPENFSAIGFTNGVLARHSNPRLSTISQHGEIMGATATSLLINRLESDNEQPIKIKLIETHIVERDTTIPVKVSS